MLAENLFNAILENGTAVPISEHTYEEMWELVRHKDGKVHLAIDLLMDEMRDLEHERTKEDNSDYPFILAAGERRDYNANQIVRNPEFRPKDPGDALRIHPDDAAEVGVMDGAMAWCESHTNSIEVRVEFDPAQSARLCIAAAWVRR